MLKRCPIFSFLSMKCLNQMKSDFAMRSKGPHRGWWRRDARKVPRVPSITGFGGRSSSNVRNDIESSTLGSSTSPSGVCTFNLEQRYRPLPKRWQLSCGIFTEEGPISNGFYLKQQIRRLLKFRNEHLSIFDTNSKRTQTQHPGSSALESV